MMRIAVVVPCYNEAERLDLPGFAAYAERHAGVHFFFVDDGSTDATGSMLARFCRANPGFATSLHLAANRGKAEAVRQGMLAALAGDARYVGFWDADLATPLEVIEHFAGILDTRPEIQLVMGSRVQLLGRNIERRPLRHYLGRIFATAASALLALRVYDTQCGAKLFRASPEVKTLFAVPFCTRWLFDVELLARLDQGRRGGELAPCDTIIYEFPLLEWRDVGGSKVRTRDFLVAPTELARIHRRYYARGLGNRPRR